MGLYVEVVVTGLLVAVRLFLHSHAKIIGCSALKFSLDSYIMNMGPGRLPADFWDKVGAKVVLLVRVYNKTVSPLIYHSRYQS
jgi:hypothetical protein